MAQISKRNILIYRLYNAGYPASFVANTFSCSVDKVYQAIVIHAKAVDTSLTCRKLSKNFVQYKTLSTKDLAEYFEVPEWLFADFVECDEIGEQVIRKFLIHDFETMLPTPTIRILAQRYNLPYRKVKGWLIEYLKEVKLSA